MTAPTAAPGEDRSVALALVNTWYLGGSSEVDRLDSTDKAAEWLRTRDLTGTATPRVRKQDLARLVELRAAVRELFTALADKRPPEANAVEVVNAEARTHPAAPQLSWPSDGPVRRWLADRRGGASGAIAAVAWDAITVVCGDTASEVRRCEAHACVRLFFREHARRRWCSTACGDRVRAMRHHRLHRKT